MKERVKKILKKNLILIGIGTVVVGTLAVILVLNIEKTAINIPPYEANTSNEPGEITKILETNYNINDVIDKEYFVITGANYKFGVINSKGETVEEPVNERIAVLPDGYYMVTNGDNKVLKRKNNTIATNPEVGKVYQDSNEESAPYIIIGDDCWGCSTVALRKNYRAAHLKKDYDDIGYDEENMVKIIYGSIIYDSTTGEIIKEIPGRIQNLEDSDFNYSVIYNNSTWYSLSTIYDDNFKNMVKGKDFFFNVECDKNEFSSVIKTAGSTKVGYYSDLYYRKILPIEYDVIYSHNENDTKFVIIDNGEYKLINDNGDVLLSGYDYMVHLQNYLLTVKGDQFRIFDNDLNPVEGFNYTLDLTGEALEKYDSGMCGRPHPYLYFVYGVNYSPISKGATVAVATTDGVKIIQYTYMLQEVSKTLEDYDKERKEVTLNYDYKYIDTGERKEIYKNGELVKTADVVVHYYEDLNYLHTIKDKKNIIYELK